MTFHNSDSERRQFAAEYPFDCLLAISSARQISRAAHCDRRSRRCLAAHAPPAPLRARSADVESAPADP